MAKLPAIRSLSVACLESTPVSYNWTEHAYAEAWESFEAAKCDECGKIVFGSSGTEDRHRDLDSLVECDANVHLGDGPMMSYYYPVPDHRSMSIEDMAKAIIHLPLCIVHFPAEEKLALALTGGGMDLSWEICEAHMRIGFLPPLHFCGLQDMCRDWDTRTAWIVAGCRESYRVSARRSMSGQRGLRQLTLGMKQRSAARPVAK